REGSIPTERRRMLLEGLDRDTPLSPAEYRVRVAAAWPARSAHPDADLRANLAAAHQVAPRRFPEPGLTPPGGPFRDPLLVGVGGRCWGRGGVFGPGGGEAYVACPFRFFLEHVLHLEPLEDPREEIEVTRRGMAVHRALARLHRRLKEAGVHQPGEGVREQVL